MERVLFNLFVRCHVNQRKQYYQKQLLLEDINNYVDRIEREQKFDQDLINTFDWQFGEFHHDISPFTVENQKVFWQDVSIGSRNLFVITY